MDAKSIIRKKFFLKRKKNYFEINKNFYNPLIRLFKKKVTNKTPIISFYYPSSFELNILSILDIEYFKKSKFLLPIIEENDVMNFYKWNKNDILAINKYGMLEPIKSKKINPNIILVPLLAFDNRKYRVGYGKGFYDKFLSKYLKINKKTLTIGIAFSFQKFHNLPINSKDIKLDYILTEKGFI